MWPVNELVGLGCPCSGSRWSPTRRRRSRGPRRRRRRRARPRGRRPGLLTLGAGSGCSRWRTGSSRRRSRRWRRAVISQPPMPPGRRRRARVRLAEDDDRRRSTKTIAEQRERVLARRRGRGCARGTRSRSARPRRSAAHSRFGMWVSEFSAKAPLTLLTANQPMPATSELRPAGQDVAAEAERDPATDHLRDAELRPAGATGHLREGAEAGAEHDGARRPARTVWPKNSDRDHADEDRRELEVGRHPGPEQVDRACRAAPRRDELGAAGLDGDDASPYVPSRTSAMTVGVAGLRGHGTILGWRGAGSAEQ